VKTVGFRGWAVQSRRVRIALGVVLAMGAVSATCFLVQGGFGGGHGNFDRVIFVLSLPWSLIPWPDFVMMSDVVWLLILPVVLNAGVVVSIGAFFRAGSRSGRAEKVETDAD
jgi:hypothetical protein